MNDKKYYAVEARCGHVGRYNCIIITFSVECESKKEAAKIVRQFPRVKHHKKDAIVSVREIDYSEYIDIQNTNHNDKYLKCTSIQEQKLLCNELSDRIIRYEEMDDTDYKELRKQRKEYLHKERISQRRINDRLMKEHKYAWQCDYKK